MTALHTGVVGNEARPNHPEQLVAFGDSYSQAICGAKGGGWWGQHPLRERGGGAAADAGHLLRPLADARPAGHPPRRPQRQHEGFPLPLHPAGVPSVTVSMYR